MKTRSLDDGYTVYAYRTTPCEKCDEAKHLMYADERIQCGCVWIESICETSSLSEAERIVDVLDGFDIDACIQMPGGPDYLPARVCDLLAECGSFGATAAQLARELREPEPRIMRVVAHLRQRGQVQRHPLRRGTWIATVFPASTAAN